MVLKILKNYSLEIIIAAVMLVLLYSGLRLANFNLNIQLKAFNSRLKQQDLVDENVSYSRLLIKYINQKELYQGSLEKDRADKAEIEYDKVFSSMMAKQEKTVQYSRFEKSAIVLINLIRKVTGNPPINLSADKDTNSIYLYQAYHYENSENYPQAVQVYNIIITNQLGQDMRANVLLHTGFCYALMEECDKARVIYQSIIDQYSGSGIAVAAALLLRYMDLFEAERQKILDSTDDALTKGEKLSTLMSHKTALKVLENYEATNKADKSRLEYIKGICYEETGEKEKALDSYVESIKSDQTTPAANYANRRIYAIVQETDGDKGILKASVDLSKKQNDTVLQEIEEKYNTADAQPSAETNPAEEADKQTAPADTISDTEMTRQMKNALIADTLKTAEATMPVMTNTNALKAPDKPRNRTQKSILIGRYVLIVTVANEEISGVLRTSEFGDYIILESVIGNVGFKKEKIRNIAAYSPEP